MGRETLLLILILTLGGLAAQPLAAVPRRVDGTAPSDVAERRAWLSLWLPIVPTLLVIAWLCGWASVEPDPVHDQVRQSLIMATALPFAAIAARALARALWSLALPPAGALIYTRGLCRPRIECSPALARALDARQLRAAWAHEAAHVRHRDPLRIWLAQIAVDLQWPWPGAHDRLLDWLRVLELARDDEACRSGISGIDLAAAIVTTARHFPAAGLTGEPRRPTGNAALTGSGTSLQARVARLLSPPLQAVDGPTRRTDCGGTAATVVLALALVGAGLLGVVYGEQVVRPLLQWTWAV
jgi:hypothetical protein